MAQRIELPGGVVADLREPSLEDRILEQMRQLTIAMNTIAGQIDMAMRLYVGALPSHEVKSRFRKHDEAVKAATQGVVQKSNTNIEEENGDDASMAE